MGRISSRISSGLGVTATNISVTALTTTGGAKGTPNSTAHPSCSAGTFTGGTGIIGFESGIILSNGGIFNVIGPNQYENVSQNNGLPGDSRSAALAGVPLAQTYDATVLQFDFTTAAFNTISFQYVFASDEYNQFANTGYNDVFAFYLTPPGGSPTKIALAPGTTDPVSINNVNLENNPQYYIDNDISDGAAHLNTEMNGLTTVLTATASIVPGETYHIKLAILRRRRSLL